MSSNTWIKAGVWVWVAMICLSVIHPVLAGTDTRREWLDAIVAIAAWQSIAMLVSIAVLILRFALAPTLSGAALWLAFIPPTYSALALAALSIYGHLADPS